jgi:hypothetical protein
MKCKHLDLSRIVRYQQKSGGVPLARCAYEGVKVGVKVGFSLIATAQKLALEGLEPARKSCDPTLRFEFFSRTSPDRKIGTVLLRGVGRPSVSVTGQYCL